MQCDHIDKGRASAAFVCSDRVFVIFKDCAGVSDRLFIKRVIALRILHFRKLR